MPRNEAKPLDLFETKLQAETRDRLAMHKDDGRVVRVAYIKRSGQPSSSVGTIGDFSGKPGYDTGSVTIHTEDKGPRTINLHRIAKVYIVE